MMKFLKNLLVLCLSIAVMLLIIFVIIGSTFDKPEVRVSNTTKECVEVLYTNEYDCGNLPKRYHHVWVK